MKTNRRNSYRIITAVTLTREERNNLAALTARIGETPDTLMSQMFRALAHGDPAFLAWYYHEFRDRAETRKTAYLTYAANHGALPELMDALRDYKTILETGDDTQETRDRLDADRQILVDSYNDYAATGTQPRDTAMADLEVLACLFTERPEV